MRTAARLSSYFRFSAAHFVVLPSLLPTSKEAGRKRCCEGYRREFLAQFSPLAASCQRGDLGYIAVELERLKIILNVLDLVGIVDQAALLDFMVCDGPMIPSYSYLNLNL